MTQGRNPNLIFMDSYHCHPVRQYPASSEIFRNPVQFERYIRKRNIQQQREVSQEKLLDSSRKRQSRNLVDKLLHAKVGSNTGTLAGLMIIPGMIKINNLNNKRSKILPDQISERRTHSRQYERKMVKSYSAVKKKQTVNKQYWQNDISKQMKKTISACQQHSENGKDKNTNQQIGMFWGKNKNLKNIYIKPNILRRKATSFVSPQSQQWCYEKTQQKQQTSPKSPTKFEKSKQMNVELILRSKYMKDFDSYIRQYQKKMQLNSHTKIFVFNSSDRWVKKILLEKGWVQNIIKDSLAYHLKWTTKVEPIPTFKKQLHNHFTQSDQLTSKSGLISNTKHCFQIRKYIPKSYQIGSQTIEFLKQFDRSLLLCLFKNIIEYLKTCITSEMEQSDTVLSSLDLYSKFSSIISSSNYFGENNEQQIIHVPYTLMLCSYLLCKYTRYNDNLLPYIDQNFFLLNNYSQQKLIAFSKHKNAKKSNYGKESDFKPQLSFGPTINEYYSQTSFATPSKQLLIFILQLDKFLKNKMANYSTEGVQNLWIIKCATSSKGTGIKISNNSDVLRCGQNKIVQKYIQKCLILCPSSKQHQYLYGKKFDLRIWVLAQKFSSPMKISYYKDFYARICADKYDLTDLNTLTKHLTNYSKNKGNFFDEQHSVIFGEDLLSLIAEDKQIPQQILMKNFHHQLKTLLKNLMKSYEGKIASQKNSFQLYGCDVLIDQQLNLHLLEVNLSPACSERVQWLTKMLQQMTRSMLQIVLQQNLDKNKPNKWIDLFQ